ncbi:MAG: GntR family transcriptional regulator [Lachnospiraceae bacterium]
MENIIPKYQELILYIKNKIKEQEFLPGDKLYSENKLCEMFSLSRQTVRHAIALLEEEGIVRRVRGSGTYIKENIIEYKKRGNRIAVITTYVDSYIFPSTIRGIEEVLSKEDYIVEIAFTNNQYRRERMILEELVDREELAGIIMETTKSGLPNLNMDIYKEILKRKIPILFINSFYDGIDIPHVSIDDTMAGQVATDYLLELGHRKVGGIFKLDDGQGHLRYKGYVNALWKYNINEEDTPVIWLDTYEIQHLEEITLKLKRLDGCTGIVCYNDEVAFSLIDILKKMGYKVPDDKSIVGIDDSDLATIGEVEISSVPHPMEALGKKAAMNLISMIKNEKTNGTYEFPVSVVKRGSAKKIEG